MAEVRLMSSRAKLIIRVVK